MRAARGLVLLLALLAVVCLAGARKGSGGSRTGGSRSRGGSSHSAGSNTQKTKPGSSSGSGSRTVAEIGPFGPILFEEPTDTLYPEDSPEKTVTLRCLAKSNPPATYRWRHNGMEVKWNKRYSLEGGNLVISDLDRDQDAGTFQCLATNRFGTLASQQATLKFAYLDRFPSEERGPLRVRLQNSLVLLCNPPPHYPDVEYQWLLNEFPELVPQDERRFVSQQTGNLYIARVEASDAGRYACLVRSTLGRHSPNVNIFSAFAPLEIRRDSPMTSLLPRIEVKPPAETVVLKGDNLRLECFALGNPVPSISWQRKDGRLPDRTRLSVSAAVLEVADVTREDEGVYVCNATNALGSVLSEGRITVQARPEFVFGLDNIMADVDQDLNWTCKAKGRPAPTYQWLKNGEPIAPLAGKVLVAEGELNIVNLSVGDSGMYQCVAENKHGIIYSNAELRVLASKPEFDPNPLSRVVQSALGGKAIVPCLPQAAPKPNITWSRGTELLHVHSRMSVLEDGSLVIPDLRRTDQGNYTCFAENKLGKANATFTLLVKDATTIKLAPKDTRVTVGENATLLCRVSHDRTLDVAFLWLHNGYPLDTVSPESPFRRISADKDTGDIRIIHVLLYHAGNYTCLAHTAADSVMAHAVLLVRGPPGPPGGVIAENVTTNTAMVAWSPGTDNDSPITRYVIQGRPVGTFKWKDLVTVPQEIEGNVDTARVEGLRPWLDYEFHVIAINTLGFGEPSQPSRPVRTLPDVPTTAPFGITGGGGRYRELTITWTPVSREYHYGPGFGYVVAFRPNGTVTWTETLVPDPDSARYVHPNASSLPYMPFYVKVRAFNQNGDGPYSHVALVYSAEDEPTRAPEGVNVRGTLASQISLAWEEVPPESFTGKLLGYEIRYWKKGEVEESADHVKTEGDDIAAHVSGLQPSSTYLLNVRAYNGAGSGPPSDTVNATTQPSPPQEVPVIKMKSQQELTVVLAWSPIKAHSNESTLTGYRVVYWSMNQRPIERHDFITQETTVPLKVKVAGDYMVETRAMSVGGEGPPGRFNFLHHGC
ncbi:contactin-2-like isoform X3 [Lethenteron reissneri]|uniref:contactin-2-like isoform X3 n=1 Tax=Lethenteron reissneri TaxID=7753 RepID=UPI002AB72C8B|nr:contactin-2-like isoform X3 [Lethenteron reissneri]